MSIRDLRQELDLPWFLSFTAGAGADGILRSAFVNSKGTASDCRERDYREKEPSAPVAGWRRLTPRKAAGAV
jgi:hypothetical protein